MDQIIEKRDEAAALDSIPAPKYSANTLSCFGHVKCAQVYLDDCSSDYLKS